MRSSFPMHDYQCTNHGSILYNKIYSIKQAQAFNLH